jgi:hypothetical protein
MSDNKEHPSNQEKRLEHSKSEATEGLKGKTIVTKEDNSLQQRAELLTSLKAHRFTNPGQQPFTIEMGENQVTDRRPMTHKRSDENSVTVDHAHVGELSEIQNPLTAQREKFGQVERGENANRAHCEKVENTINQLPENIQDFLVAHGIRIVAARTVLDELPGLKNDHPRDWNKGKTWNNVEGTFRTDRNEVIVSEVVLGIDNKWGPNQRVEGVARHETGHAIDHALGDYSINNKEFADAYQADLAKMPESVRKQLSYLLQPGYAGRQETFGELFAAINGGAALDIPGDKTHYYTNLLKQYFKETIQVMTQKLESI